MTKFIKFYTLNVYSLLYTDYVSKKRSLQNVVTNSKGLSTSYFTGIIII